MSRILNTGIIILGLAELVAAPTFARGNFDRTAASAWSHPTMPVNYHPGHAGPVLFHGSPHRKH
jgi:hypothetical protein